MSKVRVLVGTRKGAFILESDGKREKWDVSGPHFAGGSDAVFFEELAEARRGRFDVLLRRATELAIGLLRDAALGALRLRIQKVMEQALPELGFQRVDCGRFEYGRNGFVGTCWRQRRSSRLRQRRRKQQATHYQRADRNRSAPACGSYDRGLT